jgi:hypothetical protein
MNAWSPEGFCSKHGKVLPDPLEHVAPDIKNVGSEILTVVSQEMASFCEDRRNCFDFDTFDLNESLGNTGTGSVGGGGGGGGDAMNEDGDGDGEDDEGEIFVKPPLNFLFSVTTAAALLDISNSSSNNTDLDVEDFNDQPDSEYVPIFESDVGDVLCLHDDDINTSEKMITSLAAIGISMHETLRIRRETAAQGSCTFLPNFNSTYLPKVIVNSKSHISVKMTEKMKKNLTPIMRYFLILKNAAEYLRGDGLKVCIISHTMGARELRMKKTLSWLTDFSQINDGMVSKCYLSYDIIIDICDLCVICLFIYVIKQILLPERIAFIL